MRSASAVFDDPRIQRRAWDCPILSAAWAMHMRGGHDDAAIIVQTILSLSDGRERALKAAAAYAARYADLRPIGGKKATMVITDDLAGPLTMDGAAVSWASATRSGDWITFDDAPGPQESCLRRALRAPGRFLHRVVFPGKHRKGGR